MIIAALLGALTFGACVDSEESASVTAVRNAKAEQLKSVATLNNAKAQAEATLAAAEAQIAAAQAQLLAAEAAALNAATEEQKIANQIAAAEAAATIAKIEAQLELDLLKYETDLMNAQLKFAEENDKHIAALYAAYTQDLADLKAAQTALATANAALVKAEKGLASVEETYNEALAKAQDDLAKLQSKKAAKEAELEALRAAAYGGMSQLEAYAAAEDALETMDELYGEMLVIESAWKRATEAKAAYASAYTKEKYYKTMNTFKSTATLKGKDFDLKDFDKDAEVDHWGFYNVVLNSTANEYKISTADADLVALFDADLSKVVKDADKNPMYTLKTNFYGINKDAIEVYEDALANLLSTSSETCNLTIATLKLEAYLDTTEVDELAELSEEYLAEVKELTAEKAENQAEIDLIELEMYILEKADDDYYAKDIEKLQKEKDELKAKNDDIDEELAELEEEFNEAVEEYEDQGADLDDYAELVAEVKAATTAFNTKAEAYAAEVETLEELAELADEFIATYVTEYNAAVVAEFETGLSYYAKYQEYQQVSGLWAMYIDIYYHTEVNNPDGTANPNYNAADDYVQALINEAVAALDGIKSDIKAQENKIKGMSLAKDTATAEDAVAVAQAAVVDAEYKVAIAETNLAVTKAALDAAIAE